MADLGSAIPASRQLHDGAATHAGAAFAGQDGHDLVHSELRHRFRNIVAVTQSLVNQTLRDGVPIAEARDSLNHHLAAMGGALDLLLRMDWQPASLRNTIQEALAYPVDFRARILCEGPEVIVGSNAVMALTLAFHELQTNAIKYGALSSAVGGVELLWKITDSPEGKLLWMQWAERAGPLVQMPTRQGFGTQLISKAIRRVLGGEVELDYTPAGLTWSLSARLDKFAT